MTCRRTLQLSDELLSCRLTEGHGGYHEDQSGMPFGPWAEHDATPLADRPLPTTVPTHPIRTEGDER